MTQDEVGGLVNWLNLQRDQAQMDKKRYERVGDDRMIKALDYKVVAYGEMIDHLTRNYSK